MSVAFPKSLVNSVQNLCTHVRCARSSKMSSTATGKALQLRQKYFADLIGVVCAASAEALFGSQELVLPWPHQDGSFTPYWASLANNLTRLVLSFDHPLGGATIRPLSQLTRLLSLSLKVKYVFADVKLSLPQLQTLKISALFHARITLVCPQLKTMHVMSALLWEPLMAFLLVLRTCRSFVQQMAPCPSATCCGTEGWTS